MRIDHEVTARIEQVVPPEQLPVLTRLLFACIEENHDLTPQVGEKLAMSEDLVHAITLGHGADQVAALIAIAKLNPKVVLARFQSDASSPTTM